MSPLHHKARAWNSSAWWASSFIALSLLSCGTPAAVEPTPKARVVRVQAFTEAKPVHAIAATPNYLFVTSGEGLDRWDLTSGERLPLTHEHGLPGTNVFAMAYDSGRDWLWVATDIGISRYEVAASTFSELPPAPEVFGISTLANAVLAPARDGGIWIGVKEGLFYAQPGTGWVKTGVESAVNSLYQDQLGALWIAAASGLMRVDQGSVARPMDAAQSCEYASVSSVARFDDTHVVVLATSSEGSQVLALASEEGCASFEDRDGVADSGRWLGVASDAENTFVLAKDRLYRLRLRAEQKTAPLESKSQTRLRQVAKASKIHLAGAPVLEALTTRIPPDVRIVTANDNSLFLAAGRLGTMEWTASQGDRPGRWFRRSEIATDGDVLSIACPSRDLCFLSTSAQGEANALWRWDGKSFSKEEEHSRVFGVLELEDGRVLSLVEVDASELLAKKPGDNEPADAGAALALRIFENGVWNDVPNMHIQTPGTHIRVKALRQAPDGQIWVSLGALDASGEQTPFGLAVLDLSMGYVVYHRASFVAGTEERGLLPVPVDITGIGFVGDEAIWLASSQGATRILGDELKTHIEADGLRSELLEGVVCTGEGMVYVASSRGVGEWNGERWTFPAAMRTSINDLAIGLGGKLWLATDKGLGVYDGTTVRRLDTKRGLVENRITDIESDRYGRIWALSAQGLVLVSP
tara:strand:+ start:36877 stop:38964 length:2088 start_codon:yes stop_codon:yes gene_type:complete